MKRVNKNLINIIIIIAVLVICIVYMFVTEGPANIAAAFGRLNYWWVLVGLLMMLIYWFTEAGTLQLFINKMSKDVPFSATFRVTMIGQLFNCLTPFASGGQPMQAYYLSKYKLSVGQALTALISRFIIYQATLTVLSVGVIALRYDYFSRNVTGFLFLAIIGFVLNTFVIFFLIAVGYFKGFVLTMVRGLVRVCAKLRICKTPEATIAHWNAEVESFSENMGFVRKNRMLTFQSILLTLGQLVAYFALPYFIGLAFGGGSQLELINTMCAQAFVLMISSFVPSPGAAGAAEGVFLLFFTKFMPTGTVPYAMLVWRVFVFYMPIVVGALFLKRSKVKDGAPPAEIAEA